MGTVGYSRKRAEEVARAAATGFVIKGAAAAEKRVHKGRGLTSSVTCYWNSRKRRATDNKKH
jgi:hypothetical protein